MVVAVVGLVSAGGVSAALAWSLESTLAERLKVLMLLIRRDAGPTGDRDPVTNTRVCIASDRDLRLSTFNLSTTTLRVSPPPPKISG